MDICDNLSIRVLNLVHKANTLSGLVTVSLVKVDINFKKENFHFVT